MFADADLRSYAPLIEVPRYPHGLAEATYKLAPMPWIYTGAMENWPQQIAAVSRSHVLWGNRPPVLSVCRNPFRLRQLLSQNSFSFPELRESTEPPVQDGSWLQKPIRSAAGRAISIWEHGVQALDEPHYFQRIQKGIPLSATFLGIGTGPQAGAEYLGLSLQLSGLAQLNAPPYGYCGSIVPSRSADILTAVQAWQNHCHNSDTTPRGDTIRLRDTLTRLGDHLAKSCNLRGLFGIDVIWDGNEAWFLEANPRYTASMELLEQALRRPLLQWHRQVCATEMDLRTLLELRRSIHDSVLVAEQRESYLGKVILYANADRCAADWDSFIPQQISLAELPLVADIPVAGSPIIANQPVFTCLGAGPDPNQLLQDLIGRSQTLWNDMR